MALKVDGVFGVVTKRATQSYLRKMMFYTRAIDGDFGYHSQIALQRYLAAIPYNGRTPYWYTRTIDGVAGYWTWAGMSRYMSYRGVSRYGAIRTGKVPNPGTNITTQLQRFLNRVGY